jgi:DNA-directed RNA polymerase subunit RPC12/RpoP
MPEFGCVSCGTKLKAPDERAGQRVRCPRCKSVMPVPEPAFDVDEAEEVEIEVDASPERPRPLPAAARHIQAAAPGRRYGFNCQYCSSRLEATTGMAAQEGHCPTCGNTILIPILDRYGKLIDPMTGKVIKQDPHPVHAYAAAGERAPVIERGHDGHRYIRCPRCKASNPIEANNCKNCGMPFTMEGTTLEAAGGSNGFATASLVLGIVGLPTLCTLVVPLLSIIFGLIAMQQLNRDGEHAGRGLAIAGLACGTVGLIGGIWLWSRAM